MCEKLRLPITLLPSIPAYSVSPKNQLPKVSILSQADPFKVLGVTYNDSKQIIMQKLMKLMQQSPTQMATFRQAQNEIFNPSLRFGHHYFRYLAYEDAVEVNEMQMEVSVIDKIPLRNELLYAN